MARLYQKIDGEAVPLGGGGGGGGSVDIDNITITKNSDDEIQVAPAITGKINQLNNSAADMGKVLTANGDGTAEWDDILVPIDYETITKNSDGELQVSSMPYDNTESGLEADNVQDAIDETNSTLMSNLMSNAMIPDYARAEVIAEDSAWNTNPLDYTAHANGWVMGALGSSNSSSSDITVNNVRVVRVYVGTDNVIVAPVNFWVNKDDSVKVRLYGSGAMQKLLKFVPVKQN